MTFTACSRSSGKSILLLLGLLLFMFGCSSDPSRRFTLVVQKDRAISGTWNAVETKQARKLIAAFLPALLNAQWRPPATRTDLSPERLLPSSVGAWELGPDPRVYRGQRLVEYLPDAQLFFDYGFVEMVGAVYSNRYLSKEPLLQVDLFKMRHAMDAFGIYSIQRNLQANLQKIGTEAVITDETLDAWKGTYYLKIQSWIIADAVSEGMIRIAQAIFRQIEDAVPPPAALKAFPTEGKHIGTERLFHTYLALDQITLVPPFNVLQIDETTHGILAEYSNGEDTLELDTLVLFGVVYPTVDAARRAFESYHDYAAQRGEVAAIDLGERGFLLRQTRGEPR